IASPFLAAVAVNVAVAWLIVFAGIVHLVLAFRAHGAGSMIWKLLVGIRSDGFAVSGRSRGERGRRLADCFCRHSPPGASLSRARSGEHDLEAPGRDRLSVLRRVPDRASRARCGVADIGAGVALRD